MENWYDINVVQLAVGELVIEKAACKADDNIKCTIFELFNFCLFTIVCEAYLIICDSHESVC